MDLRLYSKFGVQEWQGARFYQANREDDEITMNRKQIGSFGLNKGKDGHNAFRPKEWHHLCLTYNGHSQTLSGVWVREYF